jgi:general secretion pathway protein M
MMSALTSYWGERSTRERVMLMVMAVLLAATLLWLGIWRPGVAAREAAQMRLIAAVQAREDVARQLAVLKSAPPPTAGSSIAPVELVAAAAQATGFELSRNAAEGADRVAVEIASARTPALVAWLGALGKQGLVADQVQMTPKSDGTLSVSLVLKRAK